MTNENIKKYLCDEYNRLSYTHSYIYGYAVHGMVYAARVMDGRNLLHYIATLDKASSKNGGTIQLKYKPNGNKIALIVAEAVEVKPVCTVEYLESLYHADGNKKNRGYLFETLCADVFGGVLCDIPNAKFTKCGDMTIGETHYQIKYAKATYTDERTLKNLA